MTLTSTKVKEIAAGAEGHGSNDRADWTTSPQDGKPGHCQMAQVWNESGSSIAFIDPTDPPEAASKLAAHIANCDPDTIKELCRLALIGIEAERVRATDTAGDTEAEEAAFEKWAETVWTTSSAAASGMDRMVRESGAISAEGWCEVSNIICKMFGHTRHRGWFGDGLYGDVHMSAIDGIGRSHAHITAECDRCHESYVLARFHPNSVHILDHLAKHLPNDLRSALARKP